MRNLEITVEKPTVKKKKEYLLDLMAVMLFLTGIIKIFFSGFPSIEDVWWIYAIGCGISTWLFFPLFKTKESDWIFLIGVCIIGIIFLVSISACSSGMAILGNDILEYLTGQTGHIYLEYVYKQDAGRYLIAALMILMITQLICWNTAKCQLFVSFGLTILCLIGCVVKFFSIDYGLFLLIGGMSFLFAVHGYSHGKGKKILIAFAGIVLIFIVCLIPVLLICSKVSVEGSFAKEVNAIERFVHQKKYDSGVNAMPEGNLVNVGSFLKNNETALIIKAEKPQKLYLRGRIGEIYTGISWEDFNEEVFQEGEELFYWLHKSNFYGQTMIAQSTDLMSGKENERTLEITNQSACSEQIYLPYALLDHSVLEESLIGDDKTATRNDLVSLKYIEGSLPEWYQTALWLSEHQNSPDVIEYLKKEESYRDFVYKNNLQITNTVVGTFEKIFEKDKNKEKSLSEILELIQKTLEEELTYDEVITTFNGKNDFVKFTLEQSKRGYNVHYATIATLMLRYMGVPARYVEGYFLSADEAKDYQPYDEINLTEAHAHAWTEYYMDGVGWIPFEVTPGYIDKEEWELTSVVIADGKGEGLGKGFAKSNLTYTPPKLPEDKTDLPNLQSLFRFETKQIWNMLLFVCILIILLLLVWILKRYLRLSKFKKSIEQSPNREAVVELYGYAIMLSIRMNVNVPEMQTIAEKINEISRFSNQKIDDEQRRFIENFVHKLINACNEKCNLWTKIKYHYILWLF